MKSEEEVKIEIRRLIEICEHPYSSSLSTQENAYNRYKALEWVLESEDSK